MSRDLSDNMLSDNEIRVNNTHCSTKTKSSLTLWSLEICRMRGDVNFILSKEIKLNVGNKSLCGRHISSCVDVIYDCRR